MISSYVSIFQLKIQILLNMVLQLPMLTFQGQFISLVPIKLPINLCYCQDCIALYNQMPSHKNSSISPRKRTKKAHTIGPDQQLLRQNNRLRRQLVNLSNQLDVQLQKAAKMKLKQQIIPSITSTNQSQQMQLQNANKIIERLQKSVRDYESKEAYQLSFKRVSDLESIVKKKQEQIKQLKAQIKQSKNVIRNKAKNVNQLLDRQGQGVNLNEGKQKIAKLREKIKKMNQQNQNLNKKQNEKHIRYIQAQRKVYELQLEDYREIGVADDTLRDLDKIKHKYKQAMQKVQKQNAQITKLNIKYSQLQVPKKRRNPSRYQDSPKRVSRSVQELPSLQRNKIKPTPIQHLLPSPSRIRRY